MKLKSIKDINIPKLISTTSYTPSPAAWEDQVFYFLLIDRFSNGIENGYIDNNGNVVTNQTTPMFSLAQAGNASYDAWVQAGRGWLGGNINGLSSKLGYLKRMGITAVWVSPVFKQAVFENTFHGYGIQDFLSVDEKHLGTSQDLIDLVKKAHSMGIYVILDIILNHAGNVFTYGNNGNYMDPGWNGSVFSVAGFNDANGKPTIPFTANATNNTDEAVFPNELQQPGTFTCKGHITNWLTDDAQCHDGDFCNLKNINLGSGSMDNYQPSQALKVLTEAYKYWIALADLDGFRLDTVKHMDDGATRYFASSIHEFAQTIGKEKFLIIGEITGGRENAVNTLELTGLDAALGIDDIQEKMEKLAKGQMEPLWYFNLFRNSEAIGKESHTWLRDKVVTMFDDHDSVCDGEAKARFCGRDEGFKVVLNALALGALTLGIPCVYYGSEQYFNGHYNTLNSENDVFMREAMFGGAYGSVQSSGFHFFNEASCAYQEFAKILKIRRSEIALRRGRQYLREISGDGTNFGIPHMIGGQIRSVVPWSRILDKQEIIAAINTDYYNPLTAWVTVDNDLNESGKKFTCLYSTDASQIGTTIQAVSLNGKAVNMTVPAAGCVIYK